MTERDVEALRDVFSRIADGWDLADGERRALLGGRDVALDGSSPLSQDEMRRIAHCIGIDVAIQAYYYGVGSTNAGDHIRRPHTAPDGQGTALEIMLTGLNGLAAVRRHVETLCGGSPLLTLVEQAREDGPH